MNNFNLKSSIRCLRLLILIIYLPIYGQLKVGDPGIKFDNTKYDSRYPQIREWQKAGVRGGIPFLEDITIVKTLNAGASSNQINRAISDASKQNKLVGILLKNGTYTINEEIRMKSNVALIGESRNGVKCVIKINNKNGFRFDRVKNAGIYRLTIEGGWGTPKYKWNYGIPKNDELRNVDNISIKIVRSQDCWVDGVNIYNSGRDPIRVPSNHITLRDLDVKGAHKKAGGAQGYFFIQGAYNLITGCKVTHLRHISLQGSNVEYNVVYDNDFRQEVSFHSGDLGNNLIENNRIILPSDMSPVSREELQPGDPREIATNKPVYFAIMGPWSTQHDNSKKPNYILNNSCEQRNHNYGSSTPWSERGVLYKGPKKLGLSINERINNFPSVNPSLNPKGKTLYPIILGDENEAPNVEIVSPSNNTIFKKNEKITIKATAFDDKKVEEVEFYMNGNTIGKKNKAPFQIEKVLSVSGTHTFTAIATDNDGVTTTSDAVKITVKEGSEITIPGTFEAENYDTKSGSVKIENTPASSGQNIGFIRNNDYVEYTVNVAASGEYIIDAYTSSNGKGGEIQIYETNKLIGSITIPFSGDWHSYKKQSTQLNLQKGTKKLKLLFKGTNGYLFNVDKIDSKFLEPVETTIALSPIDDAYLQYTSRFNNNIIRIEKGKRIGYLKFNLSSIGGNIKDVKLKFNVTEDSGKGNLRIYKGTSNQWGEETISNTNKPKLADPLGSITGTFDINTTHTISLDPGAFDKGIVSLILLLDSGNDFAFASKENQTKGQPELLITYTKTSTNHSNVISYEDQKGNTEIKVFPNPTQDMLTISGGKTKKLIKIYSMSGKIAKEVVLRENRRIIDLYGLPSGYYHIHVVDINKGTLLAKSTIIKN